MLHTSDVTSGFTITGNFPPADYFVRAQNINGEYADSNIDEGYSGIVPSIPTGFYASDGQIGQVQVVWDMGGQVSIPLPTYNVYEDGVKIATDVTSPYVISKPNGGAWQYKVEAINPYGSVETAEDSGSSYKVPTYISNFNATDNQIGKVTVTFSNASGYPAPTYDLYENDVRVAQNITSGYVRNVSGGNRTYYVRAVNAAGTRNSNTNTGASLQVPSAITNLKATSGSGYVTLTWSNVSGYPAPTYDLYEGNTRLAQGISSGYR